MTSTYSPSLRLELMATGDQSGTWGDTTNTNLGTLLEQAITGVLSKNMADADVTLTNVDGASDEARNAVIVLTGANTAIRKCVVPSGAGRNKLYLVNNTTTGGFSVNVITSGGTGVLVPAGSSQWLYCDGTNVNQGLVGTLATQASNNVAITGGTISGLGTPLPIASGGVGTATGAATVARVQTFTASGTYTPNANMLYCTIYACGGGGGGGGTAGNTSGSFPNGGGGSGGAGGATAVKFVSKATIGASQAVAIGARGNAGAAGNNAGSAGGATSVGSLCIGAGGLGGQGSAGGARPGVAGATTGTGDFILSGGTGSNSVSEGGGFGGNGGGSRFGAGGTGGFTGSAGGAVAGNPATGFGAGGQGGSQINSGSSAAGGAGAPGYVVIIEQCSA